MGSINTILSPETKRGWLESWTYDQGVGRGAGQLQGLRLRVQGQADQEAHVPRLQVPAC